MFSSTGSFKDVSCPFYLFGLCERPYCHFKHSKQEEAKARIEAENVTVFSKDSTDNSTLPASSLQRTLQDIENSILSEKEKLEQSKSSKNGALSKSSVLKNKPTGTPEYNPTPLNELKVKKIKGQLGSERSKYDLALLEGPDTDGEYDPASNYSTPSVAASEEHVHQNSGTIPEYARQLSSAAKRKADEQDEDGSPLAKIPKFVSVDYTPVVASSEMTDEEDEPVGNFSDDLSEKDSENESVIKNNESDIEQRSVIKPKDNELSDKNKTGGLPLEFTPEGFVKTVHIAYNRKETDKNENKDSAKKKEMSRSNKVGTHSGSSNVESREKDSEKKTDNIFNLFKEEFDSALEKCNKLSSDEKATSGSKVKLKKSHDRSHKSSSDSKSDNDSHTKTSSSKHDGSKSSSGHKDKSHDNSSHHRHRSHNSDHKHSSEVSSSKHNKDPSGSKSVVKNGEHKSDHSSSKHKHPSESSSSKYHKDVRDHATKTSSHSKLKSGDTKHKLLDAKYSSHSKSSDALKHENKSSSSEQSSSAKSGGKRGSHHSHSDNGWLKVGHSSKQPSEKAKDRVSGKSTSSKPGSDKSKKHIVSLDVDLFGHVDIDNGDSPKHDLDDDLADLDKYFEEDPFEECLKIFNEESAKPAVKMGDKKKLKKPAETEGPPLTTGKKRVALKEGESDAKRKMVEDKPKPKPSPAQVMMNRYKMMQEKALEAEREAKEKIKEKVREISAKNKEKAAATPSPSTSSLAGASATFTTYMANKNKKTTAITVTKGAKRKAHTPTVPIAKLKRPVVEVNTSSKVATNVRQRYLNLFIDECLKVCTSEEEAYNKGKEEEEAVYKRCSNKKIYLNLAVNTIKRLRTEAEQKASNKTKPGPMKLSHASVLEGAGASKASYTLHRSGGAVKLQEHDFLGADLYKRLNPYILTEEQLQENNFPRADPDKGGAAIFYGQTQKTPQKGSIKGYEKLCVRCGKVFEVYPNGKYPVKEECVYHWGKAWKKKIAGAIDTRYTCCQGDLASEGCQVAKLHVHETNKRENMTGFMKTIPSSPTVDGDYGVYALDCEMVYTTMGVELARVTVVGGDQEPVYESLVIPDNPVVDFNTRFSGISEEDLEDVHTTLRDVQAVLLSLFTDKTILIGHSLESDLQALKLIHSVVVDTSVVFPHRLGAPFKRALKNLMAEYLKKIIQDDVGGHDSLEDAVACLQLMQYRLKEDARKEGRRLSS